MSIDQHMRYAFDDLFRGKETTLYNYVDSVSAIFHATDERRLNCESSEFFCSQRTCSIIWYSFVTANVKIFPEDGKCSI